MEQPNHKPAYPLQFMIVVTVAAVSLVASILLLQSNTNVPKPTPTPAPASALVVQSEAQVATPAVKPSPIAYKGQNGKTALELLNLNAKAVSTGEGANAFVTAINGYSPDIKKEFWAFYVNGQQAQVGAGSYITKDTDTIEWRLEAINQ